MKIKKYEDYILIFFLNKRKSQGLINYLLNTLPIFGIEYSASKMIWKVHVRNVEQLLKLAEKYKHKNRQLALFD